MSVPMNNVHTEFNSPNYTPNASVRAAFGYNRSIDFITIHWWGDPNQGPSWEGVVAWLCNPRSQVSAHDVVTGTGRRVAVLVDYQNAAWHAGSALGNATSLGFELDPRCRQEDYEAAARDIADTWAYYGRIIPLRKHSSWNATQCPGNYDLNRLHQMALDIMNGTTQPKVTSQEIETAYLEILERAVDQGSLGWYLKSGRDIGTIRADLFASDEYRKLQERKAAEAAKTEWVRNLTPYVDGDTGFEKGEKLAVLPAEGVLRYNLENSSLFNTEVIPRGTIVDVVAKTTVKGVVYYISRFSKTKGQAIGLPADKLAVPAKPPVEEKPEWLKNLKDIDDKDMWTRSATPVLKLTDGSVSETLPMNTRVRISHATQVVGKDLLVIYGTETAIETVYLSDTEIKNPDDDLKKRVEGLEALWAGFMEVLGGIAKLITDFVNRKK